ncbi:molybdenum cofactor biosynthesis protein MoaE [Desulfotalea psychrophila]|uniref:Molybdopterin synthase catalytic subunit n=1 Tax=Desulfotalea psychrophila (strain LSv54 / DSM 12343) TaxID=177439 RepID=Q6AJ76_DESPS|nr:molybdenum cofactor biosynthesis protein MoaE [Desulfotalea psychrophila]CAG37604.1 similar to molybdenum cofactor biosynthesis protein [Desulfotalea psychrophila LSv54]
MNISAKIAELKKRPDFAENVGMILAHNGVVRKWSRAQEGKINVLEVRANKNKIEALRQEYLKHEGIYEILVESHSGKFYPGDDLLFIVVAGDIRENVKPVLSDLLNRIKSEAIEKREIFE